ncbi:insulinase family protein [bacterium]|nr:insulinase family protein [bacterium]
MKISQPNIIQNYLSIPVKPEQKQQEQVNSTTFGENQNNILSTYTTGQSLVSSNVPISYSKLGEISIPGLKDKASVFQLANGQKVIIAPKKGPIYVKTTYNVGSLNETENIRGISHFIEHNLFNGSKNLAPREYDKQVSDLGGYTNASTNFAVTDYFLSFQPVKEDSLEKAVSLNAQQTQFPTFPIEQLEKEKEPVKSEIDMYKDMPSDVASSLVLKNLFGVNTNSTNFILGTKDNINALNRETIMDYYNTWYTPDNAVTVITGDIDTNETIQLVSKYFNKKNDYSKINQRHYEPIVYNNSPVRADIIQPNATSASVTMAFAIPEGTSKAERDKINVLMSILSSSGSELSKELDKDGLNINIYTEKMQNKPDGASAIILSVDAPEKQIENVIKTLYSKITDISNIPPSQKELDNVKKRLINSVNESSETSFALNCTLTEMALLNNYNYFNETINNIQSINVSDISDTARKYLDLGKISMCVSHEKSSTIDTINANYTNPTNSQTISFSGAKNPLTGINEVAQNIKQYKLPNNIETQLIEGNSSAKSSLWLRLKSEDLSGIASPVFMVLNEILNRGSIYKDKDTYNDILNSNDMFLQFQSGVNGINISADFKDENINQIMSLIQEIVYNPNFTEAEFNRAKDVVRDSINSEKISVYDKLKQELYPSIRTSESKETRLQELEALTLNDIRNAYSLILSTSDANATLTAPIDEKPYITDILNNELSKLPVFKPFTIQHSNNYNIYKTNTEAKILTEVDEKSQAEIVQAYSFKRSENINDIAKIELLNVILGGSMSSRLFSDLREDKKLAYHVSSNLTELMDIGSIILNIGTTTQSPDPNEGSPANITKALEGFARNVTLLKTQNVSDKELANAKIHLKSALLETMETNSDITTSYGKAKLSPYGTNYYSKIFNAIDNISAEDIKNTANYVFANAPVTSIVASKSTFEKLNLK